MKAAIVRGPGQTPVYADFAEPALMPQETLIRVTASAISPLARARAAGSHYSVTGEFPFVAGVDGVGRRDDGGRVYFAFPRAPYGGMAEVVAAPVAHCAPIPDDLDDTTAAAIANPGMSSWVAYKERARLKPGETVLVNGATGTSGRLAVQIAKHLGAKKVIATGRNAEALESLAALGADVTIPLSEDSAALENSLIAQFSEGVDVVIDYLWGRSAERILAAAARAGTGARPIRFVQVGSMTGENITLPSAVLRATAIELMGSGLGSVPLDRLASAIGELLQAAGPAGFKVAFKTAPLSDVERAWGESDTTRRTVFVMG